MIASGWPRRDCPIEDVRCRPVGRDDVLAAMTIIRLALAEHEHNIISRCVYYNNNNNAKKKIII